MTSLLHLWHGRTALLICLAISSGYAAVHGSLAGQHASYRGIADLHIPVHHINPEEPLQPELHSRALQEGATLHSPKVPTFSLFSAMHDSVLGKTAEDWYTAIYSCFHEVRVSAEVYPLEVCDSITTCQLDGESGHFDIPATGRAPFGTWGLPDSKPQLRECFVECTLPHPGLKLDMVHLRDADDELIHANMLLEEVRRPDNSTVPKGVGMCVGPIYSAAPTFLDWVQYHADMGVEGIHLYAAVADFILLPQGGGSAHLPGSYRPLSIDSHRLLRWKVFHPSPWSLHYYGQWLIYNDCLFRWRHTYEYILFVDRDEFLHFPGKPAGKVELRRLVAGLFTNTTASVVFFGALHNVRCLTKQVPLLGSAAHKAHLVQPRLNFQVYEGYDMWSEDRVLPDFRNCSISYHGPTAGRACHPKSLVRPLAVDLMNVHFMAEAAPGFEQAPKAIDPSNAYIKHLRCLLRPGSSAWEHNDTTLLCIPEAPDYAKHTSGGVSACPAQVMMHTG